MANRERSSEDLADFQVQGQKSSLFKRIRPVDISAQPAIREESESVDDDLDVVITDLGPTRRRLPQWRFSLSQRWLVGVIAAVMVGSLITTSWLLLRPQPDPLKGTLLYSLTNLGSLALPGWTREVDLCTQGTSIQAGCGNQHLAFVDGHGHLYLWNSHSGVLTRPITFDPKSSSGVPQSWSWVVPGRYMAVFFNRPSSYPLEEIWDVVYDRQVLTISNGERFELSSDGNWAAVVTTQDTIQILSLHTSGLTPAPGTVPAGLVLSPAVLVQTFSSPHFSNLVDLSWSPDSDQLATASSDGTIQTWEASSGILLQTLHVLPPGYSSSLTDITMVWAPGEQSLATITGGLPEISLPQIWDLQTGQLRLTYNGHTAQPTDMVWLSGDKELLSFSGNEVLLWNAFTGQTLLKLRVATSINSLEDNTGPQFSLNGHFLVLPVDTGAQIVDLNAGKLLPTIPINGALLEAVLSPDGTHLVTVNYTGQVQIWNVQNQQVELTYKLPARFQQGGGIKVDAGINLVYLAWSPDGTMLAVTYLGGGGGLVVLNVPE